MSQDKANVKYILAAFKCEHIIQLTVLITAKPDIKTSEI